MKEIKTSTIRSKLKRTNLADKALVNKILSIENWIQIQPKSFPSGTHKQLLKKEYEDLWFSTAKELLPAEEYDAILREEIEKAKQKEKRYIQRHKKTRKQYEEIKRAIR